MKTIQIFRNSILVLGLALSFLSSMSSCKKESTVEPQQSSKMAEASATYNYYSRFYTWDTDSESLLSLGTEFYDDGIMEVKVVNKDRIEFREEGELMFTGVNLNEQEGGFTFDVQEQTVNDADLGTIQVKGWEHFRDLGEEVQGVYVYTFEYLNLGLEFEVDGVQLVMLTEFSKID
ncbi:MAG: hypothetical protein AAF849_12245 [Bacteroidota bacterium]